MCLTTGKVRPKPGKNQETLPKQSDQCAQNRDYWLWVQNAIESATNSEVP